MKNKEGFAQEGAFELGFMKEARNKHMKMGCENRVPGEGEEQEGRQMGNCMVGCMGNGEQFFWCDGKAYEEE